MMAKFILSVFIVLITLSLFAYTDDHSETINTEINIKATPTQVWQVIADIQSYSEWNPYQIEAESSLIVGEEIFLTLMWPNGLRIAVSPIVIKIDPENELTWGGGIKQIFHGHHVFLIQQLSNGSVKFIQKATFTGILTYLIPFRYPEEGYRNMNNALKSRVESNI